MFSFCYIYIYKVSTMILTIITNKKRFQIKTDDDYPIITRSYEKMLGYDQTHDDNLIVFEGVDDHGDKYSMEIRKSHYAIIEYREIV